MADYIEWTGTVKLPKGPWAETHEFTGEVRQIRKGESYIERVGSTVTIRTWKGDDPTVCAYPILRPKKPKWQPPAHLVGTGWKLRHNPKGILIADVGSCVTLHDWVVKNSDGTLTAIGVAMQLDPNNLPDLKPGEEIVL